MESVCIFDETSNCKRCNFIIEKMASLNDSVNNAGNALGKAFVDGANIAIRG